MAARRVRLAVAAAVGVVVLAGGAVAARAVMTGDERLDLVVVGDSFAEQSGQQLLALADEEGLEAEVRAFGGTSICSWEDDLERYAAEEPRVLVLSFAGNNLHPCITDDPHQARPPEEVAADYRADLEEVLALYREADTDVYVAPPPPVGPEHFEVNAAAMRDMYREALADHPELGVVDATRYLDPEGTGFQPELPCEPWDGCEPGQTEITVRQDDGIHLTPAGGERYARAVLDAVTAGSDL